MRKLEEKFIEITDYIKNVTGVTSIDMKIYWMKLIHKTSSEITKIIEDEFKLGE